MAENKKNKEVEPEPVVIKREPEKDLVTWKAPARPFKRRNRDFYVTVIAISAIVGLIVFLTEGWIPVLLIISLVFLFYVMSSVEPETIEYKITTWGIDMAGKKNEWNFMSRFWFIKRYDNELLVVETMVFPGRLEFVITANLKDKIKKAMTDYLVFEEAPASLLDKASMFLSKRLPKG